MRPTTTLAESASQLVRTAHETSVLLVTGPEAAESDRSRLAAAGCEVFVCSGENHQTRLGHLLDELGRRQMTNVLAEGGSRLLGSLLDLRAIDEVHLFLAPKLCGGASAPSPIAGAGIERIAEALHVDEMDVQRVGPDLYISGRLRRPV